MEFKTELYPEGDDTVITGITVNYSQMSEKNADDTNDLELSICNQGAGFYFVMKTDRWAFNNVDELLELIQDFKNKANI